MLTDAAAALPVRPLLQQAIGSAHRVNLGDRLDGTRQRN